MEGWFLRKHLLKILITLAVVAVIYGIAVISTYRAHFPGQIIQDISTWGQLGDYLGGLLNPVFSLLAFFALLITIVIQTKELAISSEELKKSAEALSRQSKSLDTQNFENTFFQMLRLYNEIVKEMDTTHGLHEIARGRNCFRVFYENFKHYYQDTEYDRGPYIPSKHVDKVYMVFFKQKQDEVGHYFRNLYTLVQFVDVSDEPNKKTYINIIRAQLSSYELILLFYNCLSQEGLEKFKPLIEKYQILENMDSSLLIGEDHKPLYDHTAFGE
ncbi:MAG: putative phage abortive infection protein [Candidatus Thiodiazotropha lotti]|nr:putative phage abortive infection protein [Candidatus Thiodiazotropha lotti]MCW4221334.1 putative phage abortive infection protein [Candidatus Thiodiazotropha lotti]